jgi:hypothetical protein
MPAAILDIDALTNEADEAIILQNLGRHCSVL